MFSSNQNTPRILYRLLCMSAILGMLGACQFGSPNQHNESTPTAGTNNTPPSSKVLGSYLGTLPCADCPGIDYQLSLYNDSTFQSITAYQGRGNELTDITTGQWEQNGDTIYIIEDKSPKRFLFTDDNLTQLNSDGQLVTGALASYYILKRLEGVVDNRSLLREKAKAGVLFLATGNEPGWNLEIRRNQLVFRTMNGDSLVTPSPSINPNTDTLKTYNANNLKVNIRNIACTDDMSGRMFPCSVEVVTKDKTYHGCGQYLK
jgi:uncharacterized membrane protein